MQKRWIFILSLIFSVLITGCAALDLPFLDAAPAAESAPTQIDPATLSTMIAEAAAQKVAETLAAIPPTETLIPTATETPQPTATQPPTATLTPTSYPESGSELIKADEETRYYDYTNGYALTLPANWLPIRPGEIEYAEAWGLPVASYREINLALQRMQSLDPQTFRLFILDIQEGHFENAFLSNINLTTSPTNGAGLDEIFAQSVLELPKTIEGLVVVESNIIETEDGNRYGEVVAVWDSQLLNGEPVSIYQKQALYIFNDMSLVITFSSSTDFKDTILSDFDTMLTSLISLR